MEAAFTHFHTWSEIPKKKKKEKKVDWERERETETKTIRNFEYENLVNLLIKTICPTIFPFTYNFNEDQTTWRILR